MKFSQQFSRPGLFKRSWALKGDAYGGVAGGGVGGQMQMCPVVMKPVWRKKHQASKVAFESWLRANDDVISQ